MPSLNAAARNTAADSLAAPYAAATLNIYDGVTLLVSHTLTGFGAATGGTVTANAIADETVAATGTAASAKFIAGGNEVTLSVGLSGSGAEVIMSSLSLTSGGNSSVTSVTLTMPAS